MSISPEAWVIHCLGVLREPQMESVPGFREVAQAGGGRIDFVREGEPLLGPLWGLLIGDGPASWGERPF